MPNCAYCNTFIIFGGKKQGGRTFCNDKCLQNGYVLTAADRLSQRSVDIAVDEVHQGECPKCGGPGPVDVHVSHTVWSVVYLTSWKSKPHLCCRSCGRKEQLGGLLFSGLLGWWGFPWGLIMAPIQVCRNISGMIGGPDPDVPSEQLESLVRVDLAERVERGLPLPGGRPHKAAASVPAVDEPIPVECDACGKRFKAKASLAGRSGKCPGCGSPITVPEPEDDLWEDEQDEWGGSDGSYSGDDDYGDDNEYASDHDGWQDESDRRPASRRGARAPRKSSVSKVIIVLGSVAAGLFIVGLLSVAGILIARGNRKPGQPAIVPPAIAQNQPPPGMPDPGVPNVEQAELLPDFGGQFMPDRPIGETVQPPGDAGSALPGSFGGNDGASEPAAESAVPPLADVDPSGRLWVVLSNLRAVPGGSPGGFRRPFRVDYQLAGGTADTTTNYVLHVTSSRGGGLITHYVDVPVELQASGAVEFVTPPTFGAGSDFQVAMAVSQGRDKWQEFSGRLAVGGDATVAQTPPTIQEVAGAAAQGKLLAIANPEFSTGRSPFPTLAVDFVLQQAVEPTGYYFLVVESSGSQRVEFDVSQSVRRARVNDEGEFGGRLLGPGGQIRPPFTLYIEKRRTPIPSRIRREEPEIVSNRVNFAG